MEKELRKQFDADISDTEAYIEDGTERMRQTWELFQTMEPKQVIADETLFRELKDRFGSPFGWGEYFRGGMGAESVRDLLQQVDLDAEREELEDQVKTAKGQKQSRAVKRLKVVSAFIHSDNKPEDMVLEAVPGDPAGAAPDGAAGRWPLRDLRPERPLPPRHQPEQPAEAAARPRRARDHRQQREADAPGGRRRAVRQRPPRPARDRAGQPPAQVAQRHAQGQAGPLPPEPARQARGLLGPFGHRGRPRAAHPPVRAAEADGPRAVQAVHHGAARRAQVGAEHQGRQEDGRLDDPRGLGRARGGHPGAPGAAQPRADAPPPRPAGVRAGAGRGQGDPGPPARLPRVQRRLRRRPDGRARAAVRRGSGRGAAAHAVGEQHPVAGARRAARHAHAGHGARLLLPDLRAGRGGAGRAARGRAGRQVGREEARQAAARVPFGAGGRALVRQRQGLAARPRGVPPASHRRAHAHDRRADHLQRAHRARARGGARRRVRPDDLRVREQARCASGT